MSENMPNPIKRRMPMPLRVIRARPRLIICALLAMLIGIFLPHSWRIVTRLLISWNVLTGLYVILVGAMMKGSTHENIRRHAKLQDEGQWTILFLALIAAIASLGAIILELNGVKDLHGLTKSLHVGLVGLTILMSFIFIHLMFTLHYAHEYYAEWQQDKSRQTSDRGGLSFPATVNPRYIDFIYFAFVVGVASQTADVSTTSRAMRVIVVIHGIVAFFFNTTVLALTINIAAGLI